MKKYLISLFVIGYSLLVMPEAALAGSGSLSLEPSSGTFNKGCSFSVAVVIDTGGAETDGTDAIIFYDASRFSITSSSITSSTSTYADFPGNNVDESGGKITISGLASVSTPFKGRGTLATLQFGVKADAPTGATQIKFDFDPYNKGKTTDSNIVERNSIADVLNSVVNGSYTIGTGACAAVSPTPRPGIGGPTATVSATPKVTASPTPTPAALPGGGTVEFTATLAIIGGILTVLGILGLALL